ncbi:DUF3413 domain-containing protein [Gallaecimonas kandeliae]|uniref:DUF3413 domain-containing protein n=1 Tax=Gallaecimonas kandeliae TaxID=3029055 RepID=UPI00264929E4|nr:DUF3413 domain-containing protein [Gallaecimonas kandeliae]WKE67296.1 DUF3413 domain-containing protein [Gallaecimonas kandeliae]
MTGQEKDGFEPRLAERISRLINWGHWFTFFNILLAMVIGSRYLIDNGLPDSFLGLLYTAATWAGHFAFLTFILYIVTLFPLSILVPLPRLIRFAGALVATLGQGVLLADTFVFGQYRLHLNGFIWDLIASGEGQILTKHYFTWMALGGLMVLIFALELTAGNYLWKRRHRFKEKRIGFNVATAFVACFFASHSLHIWADARLYYPILRQGAVFPLSYPATAKAFLASHGLLDMEDYQKRLRDAADTDSLLKLPKTLAPFEKTPKVLLVVVEGLRADALNGDVMPNLEALADGGLRFNQHFAGSNEPKDGLFSLFYGLPAVYQDAVRLGRDPSLLVQSFRDQGDALGIFASDGFKQNGLDQTAFQGLDIPHFQGSVATRDQEALNALLAWTAKQQGGYFGYLQLGAPASFSTPQDYSNPYQPDWQVVNLAELDNQSDITPVKNRYLNAVHYADGLLGQLIDKLKASGQLDDTLLLVTSDHGMEFNDNRDNSWGYNSNFSRYQTQVPLVIHWPGMTHQVINHITSHQDILPTLAGSAFGSQVPASTFSSGASLFADTGPGWVILGDFHQFAVLQNDRVLVMDKMGQYSIRDNNYQPLDQAHVRVGTLMDALKELKRFYR